MAFNIESIRQNISSLGYAKRNKFEVFIQAPKILENSLLNVFSREINVFNLNRILRYRIEQVDVPGVSLLSSDVKLYGVGPTHKMPYNAQYLDTTFSILLDKNTDIWDFWYNWINSIVNFNGAESSGNSLFFSGTLPSYSVKYKDDYSTNMMIVMYDDQGNEIKKINLYNAFPSSIKQIPLSWDDNTNLLRISVSITYSSYTVVGSGFSDFLNFSF